MNKILLIIENENSFGCNYFFDETIIDKRKKTNDFDTIFQIIFSQIDCKKILAFRIINLKKDNKFEERFYASKEYKKGFGDFDYSKIFLDSIKTMDTGYCGYICGGTPENIKFIESALSAELKLENPYDLYDEDLYFKK